jgi:hypothetical protein
VRACVLCDLGGLEAERERLCFCSTDGTIGGSWMRFVPLSDDNISLFGSLALGSLPISKLEFVSSLPLAVMQSV